MANTKLTISHIPTLPSTSNTTLLAGWLGRLNLNETFALFANTGVAGIALAVTHTSSGHSTWSLSAWDSGGNEIVEATMPIAMGLDGWHSWALSVNIATQTIQFLGDLAFYNFPVSDTAHVTWFTTHQIAFFPGSDSWSVGPNLDTIGGIGSDMGDFRFGAGETFFDLTSPTNVAKLFAVGNHPVSWGTDGSLVTGSVPAVFLTGLAGVYANNAGSGGSFTDIGDPLTDVAGPT